MIMNKGYFVLILLIIPITIYAQESENEIPEWIKIMMVLWGDGLIEDKEMLTLFQWLIDNNIIQMDTNAYVSQDENQTKLDDQEKKHKEEKTTMRKDWETLRIQHDQKVVDLKKDNDERIEKLNDEHDGEIEEYTDLIHNRDRTIEELKQELKNK